MKLLVILIFTSIGVHSQNYISYHNRINKIQERIIEKDFETALAHFDTISKSYDFIFAKDCIKALQIAIELQDEKRATYWLKKSVSRGIPLWYLKINNITLNYIQRLDQEEFTTLYENQHDIYLSTINTALKNSVDSLLVIDQEFTDKVNDGFWLFRVTIYNWKWKKNNKKQLPLLIDLVEQHGYPGEKLIGLDIEDDSLYKKYYSFMGPDFIEESLEIMLIHCYSDPMKDKNDLFLKEIQKGNMKPYEYGAINDFMAKYGKGKYGDYKYYNVWHKDPDENNVNDINDRRVKIGLPKFDIQQEIGKMIVEYRKNKVVNNRISLY